MGTEDLLGEYLAKSRATQERLEHSEVVSRIEAIFNELKLPWQREGDSWVIHADVGMVHAGLDDEEKVLTIHQFIHDLTKPAKKQGEYLYALLRQNASTTGACFAIFEQDSGPPSIVILARISAPTADAEEIALALENVFAYSALYDA